MRRWRATPGTGYIIGGKHSAVDWFGNQCLKRTCLTCGSRPPSPPEPGMERSGTSSDAAADKNSQRASRQLMLVLHTHIHAHEDWGEAGVVGL
jgi:hypothetical protein